TSVEVELYPVTPHVKFEVAVKEGHPRLKPGAKVRAWLPFPQEYRQQHDVKLISSSPADGKIASTDAPQRSIYFEQTVTDPSKAPRFEIEFEYVNGSYCPKLDPAKVKPYDENSALY